jgi:signal transduction histidine kinase
MPPNPLVVQGSAAGETDCIEISPASTSLFRSVEHASPGPCVESAVERPAQQLTGSDGACGHEERLEGMAFDAAVAEERERRRLAKGLHDRVSQALALARLELTSVRGDLLGESRRRFDGAMAQLEQAAQDTSEILFELSPPILYDFGLEAALAWLAEDLEKRYGIRVAISGDGQHAPLDDAAKAVVFRTVRALLREARRERHVEVELTLRLVEEQLCIDIAKPRGLSESAAGRNTLASARVPLFRGTDSTSDQHGTGDP